MRRDPELALARKAKRVGISKPDYMQKRGDAMRASAKTQGWTRVELVLTLADIQRIADKVWPA